MAHQNIKIAQDFVDGMPHSKALGMTVMSVGEGEFVMEMPYNPDYIGDPATGVIHGGAVFALLDSCCGGAAISHPEHKGVTATIDLRVDYMRPASPGQRIRAVATCYNRTRSVAFVRAVAMDDREDKPVATAAGAFVTG